MVNLWLRTVGKGTNTVVLLSIGSFSAGEKMSPEETAANICTLSDQIGEEVSEPSYHFHCIRGFPLPYLAWSLSWQRSLGEHLILPVGVPRWEKTLVTHLR